MNHALDMEREPVVQPMSVTHFVHTLRAYAAVIVIAMISVAVGYAVYAILLYILSPAQRTTMQPFRLEFRGASLGTLPNGVRFEASEIVGTPIVLKVFQDNDLSRFTSPGDFSRSVFVLETNPAYEKLMADYQSRMSDPRLLPLDRDRIQKEFESKRDSINRNEFAISYTRNSKAGAVPETLVRKALIDILNTWAAFSINEQHALDYRVAVLSPQIIDQTEVESADPVVAIEVLRSKIYRVIDNIQQVSALPSAELVKTSDHMSLAEVRIRLEDLVRFQLEPLVGVSRASGLITNPAVTIHFLENQLAYEQRRQQAAEARARASREALAMYSNEQRAVADSVTTVTNSRGRGTLPAGEGETVMPQLTDTFLDRLIGLSKQAVDSQYRQKLIDDYRSSLAATIPLEEAVSYQSQVLTQMKSGAATGPQLDKRTVQAQIASATSEARGLIAKVNEIYLLVLRNLNPSTQLFSLTAPPTTRIERATSLSRLVLYGMALLFMALPVIIILCMLHNRVREDEAAEHLIRHQTEEPA